MIATTTYCMNADRRQAEWVTRLRLAQLQHSDDPQTAAIATVGALLLRRIDQLVEALGGAA